MSIPVKLSRREREIMDVLFQMGQATAAEVQAALPEAPSYSAVRTLLRILEEKGHIAHENDGTRYVYKPKAPREAVRNNALTHVVQTFFEGSAAKVVSALLGQDAKLSPEELEEIARMVARARKDGKS